MEGRAAHEASWRQLQQELERERRWVGRLRGLRTRTRVSLVAGLALAPAVLMALRHGAWLELAHGPELAHGAVAGLIVALTAALLSSLGEPRRGTRRAWLAGLSAFVPLAGALALAELGETHEPASAAACFGLGIALAAPSVLLALIISRTPVRGWTEVALLAGLSGISASLMLDVHCASRQLVHLVLGHALIGICAGVGWAAASQAAATGSAAPSGKSNTNTISKMS